MVQARKIEEGRVMAKARKNLTGKSCGLGTERDKSHQSQPGSGEGHKQATLGGGCIIAIPLKSDQHSNGIMSVS